MLIGVLFALLAGLMWGLIFVAPLLVDGYPPALLASGRYLAFGLDNERPMYEFGVKRTPADYSSDALRRGGVR